MSIVNPHTKGTVSKQRHHPVPTNKANSSNIDQRLKPTARDSRQKTKEIAVAKRKNNTPPGTSFDASTLSAGACQQTPRQPNTAEPNPTEPAPNPPHRTSLARLLNSSSVTSRKWCRLTRGSIRDA